MKIDLNGNWKIALIPHHALSRIPRTWTQVLEADTIEARVPGNFELDLLRAGRIEDPFFGLNPLKMQAYENTHVFYARQFHYQLAEENLPAPQLVFEGLDTAADIYLNGEKLGDAKNMFIPHTFPLPKLKEGENDLVVHIHPACLAARDNPATAGTYALRYNFEALHLRKAPHMFGWDIMPRLVSAGIYRPVYIQQKPLEHIRQAYVMTAEANSSNHSARIIFFYDVDIGENPASDYQITVSGECGDSRFTETQPLWFTSGKIWFNLHNAKLWWPKGYGEAHLYNVQVRLEKSIRHCGLDPQSPALTTLDTLPLTVGIRTVKLVRSSVTDPAGNGNFHFEVNGKRVFVMGTNWVPADAYHSRDIQRLPHMMALLADIGCNTVRCWGGNIYEDPYFYETCDKMGIMVWQDFALACGVYPTTPDFCDVMREEATAVVRLLRQHPSIILWSGDNECDSFAHIEGLGRNPNQNRITREIFPEVLYNEDPARPYLPSSPYIDEEAFKLPMDFLPENHLWGPRDYFKGEFYKGSFCHFASEMGYHGCPSVVSMKKFLSADKLWPWQNNDEWLAHAASPELAENGQYYYRIELMAKQIRELFGHIPDTLEDFVMASQISQAEAKKFFIEMFRTGQPRRTGIIWWNLIDGWPQFSDAVVDYFFEKKLAYHYIKQSQQPLLLTFMEPKDWRLSLAAVNNAAQSLDFTYSVKEYDSGKTVLSGQGRCEDQAVRKLGALPYSQGEKKLYLIEWQFGEKGENKGRNHYLAGFPPFSLEWYSRFLVEVFTGLC